MEAAQQPQPSEQWQKLKAEFETLCEKQEGLYKPDYEAVFKALFEIDSEQRTIYNTHSWNMGEALPNEADNDKLQMALTKTGFANDEAFCKAFVDYANTTIQGKKVQQQMTHLNVVEVMSQRQAPQKQDGWQFYPISIIAPQWMHDDINALIEADAKEGKGLFKNLTTIPTEDESEDDYLMIEVYNCKASLVSFVEEIKRFGIIGNSNALFKRYFKLLLLATVNECATVVENNTDKPAAAKNHITATLKKFDIMSVWGLLLQILILQGLCRWMESVNINEGDNGFNEMQCFYKWLCEALLNKMLDFCSKPFGEGDKERLKPLCDYLYSTELGKMVQEHLFGEPQQEATPAKHSEPSTERAKEYFAKAVEAKYMKKTDTGYKWTFGGKRGAKTKLAYFIKRVYNPDGFGVTPFKSLEDLFGVSRLDSITSQMIAVKKPQQWRMYIDKLFEE